VAQVTGNGDIAHAPPLQTRQGSKDSQNEDDDNGKWFRPEGPNVLSVCMEIAVTDE